MPTLLQLLESENKILLDKFSLAKQDQMAAENRTEELRRRVQLLSTQLMEAEEKIQWHKNRMDAKDREVASMEEEINRLREERDHYRTKNGSSNYSVSSEQKSRQVRVVSQQDGDLKRIRELQTEVEELNSRLRAAEEDQRQLVTERKKNALLEEEKERLIRAIRELEIKLEAADREVANTQERIHRIAQAQVRAELEDESKLKGMSQELREEQKALEHRAKELARFNDKLKADLADSKERLALAERDLEKEKVLNSSLSDSMERLERERQIADSQIKQLQSLVGQLKVEFDNTGSS